MLALVLAAYWVSSLYRAGREEREEPSRLFAATRDLFQNAQISAGEANGVYKLDGLYQGRLFQLKVIVDNLVARKLPTLWLMVTRPEPQPVSQTIDIMMRPGGPVSFSNFDLLDQDIPLPSGFPAQALARSDQPAQPASWAPWLNLATRLHDRTAKEVLVSPKGLRLVALLAQADRARYGVFRQADFGKPVVNTDLVQELLHALMRLEDDLKIEAREK